MTMQPSPQDVAKTLKGVAPAARQLERIRGEGVIEGRTQARKEVVDFLQKKYMGPKAPDRDSPEAKAILRLVKEVVQFMTHTPQRG